MQVNYNKYWGKKDGTGDYHLLPYHCLDAAAVGTVLVKNDPFLISIFEEDVIFKENPRLLSFLLAVHDLGKFSKPFQEKIKDNINNEAGHTEETFWMLRSELKDEGVIGKYILDNSHGSEPKKIKTFRKSLVILIESVSGHHGRPVNKDGIKLDSVLGNFGKENKEDARGFILDMLSLFLPEINLNEISSTKTDKMISWILAGLCVVSDWISSNNNYFKWKKTLIPLEEYWSDAVLRAEEVIPKTGLIPPTVSDIKCTKEMFGFEPRPLQKVIDDFDVSKGANLFIIEETTGEGKTEASLVLAQKLMKAGCADGFYFALPTMATANAIYDRIAGDSKLYEKFYSENQNVSVVLAHGQRILSERYQDFIGNYGKCYSDRWIYDSNKKALLSSIGVGTIDQVLMGVLPWKHQCLRLFGIARNILIIDEVHAYDTYMNSLLKELLVFLKSCGCSVIMLSATIPKNLKNKFLSVYTDSKISEDTSPYPLITHVNAEGILKEIPVKPSPEKFVSVRLVFDKNSAVDEIIDKAKKGGCACWVCNTVSDTISIYHLLKSKTDLSIHLFHARFAMGDRLNRENDILKRFGKMSNSDERRGQILIATQVVEQSLDLDFDFMISDLAPIDLIIQRAGRLWRHSRVRPSGFNLPEFVIYSPNPNKVADEDWYSSVFRGGGFVYPEHGKLWRTADILSKKSGFSMPKDARLLIDSVYSEDYEDIPDVLRMHESDAQLKNKVSDANADSKSLKLSKGYGGDYVIWSSEEPALTREGDNNVTVEMLKEENGKNVLWFNDKKFGNLLSRVNVSYRKIDESIFSNYSKNRNDEPLQIVFRKDGDVWRPVYSMFKDESIPVSFKDKEVYYSLEEGLVFPT